MKETAYLLQSALVSAWWIGVASSEAFFAAFQFAGISSTAFWSFFVPDTLLIALLSTLRAYRNVVWIEYIVLGAFGYAAFYCCNAMLLTGTGFLSAGLMLLGLLYNIFLCFNESLFRSASSSNIPANAFKTLVQIICIWILTLVVIPYVILDAFDSLSRPNQDFSLWMGMALFFGFSLLGLTSSYFMVRDGGGTPLPLDQTNQLVVSGPYRFVRNPMAVAGIGQGVAVAAIFQSIPILIYSFVGAVIWHFGVRPIEERDMAKRFGAAYLDYRKQVSCWVPKFRRNVT